MLKGDWQSTKDLPPPLSFSAILNCIRDKTYVILSRTSVPIHLTAPKSGVRCRMDGKPTTAIPF